MADDNKLETIREQYTKGEMLTGELKKILIDVVNEIVQGHQNQRKKITAEDLTLFQTPRKLCSFFNDM